MQALSRFGPRPGRTWLLALVGVLAAVALALATRASAAVAPSTCPAFRVLHDDRIGPAVLPAGSYELKIESSSLTCKSTAELFARFLEDYDGVLPASWKVTNEGTGKASFARGEALPGFSVTLEGGSGGGSNGGTNPILGTLCPGTFTVKSTTVVGALRFTKGKFLVYLPSGSAVTCKGAAALFAQFLGAGGPLPQPWKLINQTATFYRPAARARSAFRIEPLNGSGPR